MVDQVLVFKNNLPNLTVLKLYSQDFDVLKAKLQQKLKQAPMMFVGMQVIIDISAFDKEDQLVLDVIGLLAFLRGESINPVAMMTDRESFRDVLFRRGLGVLPVLQKNERTPPPESMVEKPSEEPRKTFNNTSEHIRKAEDNQTLRHPVRSGQRLFSKGDLTIVGSVSRGAEIIAEGNIHVYGKLSGRAIAGASGDESVSIFCQHLDAELVSIAGSYKQLEDIDEVRLGQPVQISLEDEKIRFFPL